MKSYRKHLRKLQKLKRKQYHPLLHKIHKKHKISKKTLFYVKEYGPHTNIPKIIIKESIKILLLASIISSLGGLSLETNKTIFVSILPLVILLPVLNNMIGTYGSIFSSHFSTLLHEGKIKEKWYKNSDLRKIFVQLLIISGLMAIISSALAMIISGISGFTLDQRIIADIFFIAIIDVLLIVLIMCFVAVFAGIYFFKKKEDPNNFLIPISTSIADFGNMIILSLLIILLF